MNQVPHALAPAIRLARYEIGAVLGRGAFGITYRAVDTLLGREVAIKEFLPADMAHRQDATLIVATGGQDARFAEARRSFLEEARTLAALDATPGIVRVLDFLEANGTAYMVMPLLHGRTLEAELQEAGTIPEARLRELAGPLLAGLARVHAAGFLHRDIKPANIILSDEAGPTLLDFGAARAQLAGGGELTRIYTPGYAPLEQLTGGRQGPWTDIYAFAATLHECMTGVRPPATVDRLAGTARLGIGDEASASYGRNFREGVQRALSLRPEDRPQSIADWQRLLGTTVAAGASVTPTVEMPETPASGATARPPRGRWRRPAFVAVTALAVIALAIAWHGGTGPLRQDPPPQPVAPKAEVAPAPDQAETALELTPYDIERIQVALTAQGFGVAGVDGVLSPDARAMIAAWQGREAHATTGYLDRPQYEQLLRQSAEAIARYDEEQRRGKGDR